MMWIGLIAGVLVGGFIWELPGAVVLGFLGWLAGLIIQSHRRPPQPGAVAMPKKSLEARVERLERIVAELQKGTAPIAAPASEPVREPEPVPEPEPEPAVVPAQAATRSPPPEPAKPNFIVAWLTGGNTIARVGLLILFFGLAFLAKYAADHQMLPVELRVAGVALAGIALLVFGWRLRARNPGYALGLQGGGVAVLYLTIFAAMRLWKLLPPEMAFVLLALVAAFSAALAIAQNSMALAIIAAAGGFVAPILASTGGGSHVTLFSYYLLLNLGIAAIALFKAWRPLNLTGFLFTFFIGAAWGWRAYQPRHFETTEPFLISFWLLYIAIAVIFARRQPAEPGKFVDGTLVFGTPLAAFALQAGLMRGIEMGLAFSSLAAAAVYTLLGWLLLRTGRESWRLLAQAFVALGVVFATMAIPLALDARWTSAMWALEGAAIVWLGLRQDQKLARWFGLALQILAAVAFVMGHGRVAGPAWLDSRFLGAMLLAAAALWTHRQLLAARARVSTVESKLVPFFIVWGLLWWIAAGRHEIQQVLPWSMQLGAKVALLGVTALVLTLLAMRWDWPHAAVATRWLLPALALCALAALPSQGWIGNTHPFQGGGWATWPLALAVHFWSLRKLQPARSAGLQELLHAGGIWLVALVGVLELHWVAAHYTARGTAWSVAAVGVALSLAMGLPATRWARERWPVSENPTAYLRTAPLVLALTLAFWSIYGNVTHDARSDPLPYLPLLNALDLTHVLALIALATVALAREPSPFRQRASAAAIGVVVFVWLNGVLLRTLHHWADIPYTLHAMERSVLAQASLSIFWSILALGLMIYATRTARRALWMVGAGLMGVVVLKLFLVDLSHVGGIERIVSFIAVGVLMLVIGYFSPVPPRRKEASP